jgi:cysteine desulfurase
MSNIAEPRSDTRRVNLDVAAGTPLLPEVKAAITVWLDRAANPSALYAPGREARQALELARQRVASLISARPEEITFTSSGSESNVWALRGLLEANRRKGNHLIVSAIEHPSVLLTAKRLERDGYDLTYLPVMRDGVIEAAALREALKPTTALVSIMVANGEIGTIQAMTELSTIAREAGALVHSDAIAAVGHMPIAARTLRADAVSLAANQFYGPSGVAALFVRDGVRILPLIDGGGQETGARSGTEALPLIIGMGVAADCAQRRMTARMTHTLRLRDRLMDGIMERATGVRPTGSFSSRLPHNLHLCVEGVSSESLVLGCDQVGVSVGTGSACNSKAMRPSHVLKALGLSDEQAKGALQLTVGEQTTQAEVERAAELIAEVIGKVRAVTAMTVAHHK